MIAILTAFAFQGCIHTYPEGSGDDPTEIMAALEINLGMDWTEEKIYYGDDSRSAQSPSLRATVSISHGGTCITRFEKVIDHDEIKGKKILLPIPVSLDAEKYDLCVWCDYVDPIKHTPYGYDVSSFSDIKPYFGHGSFLTHHDSRSYSGAFDLKSHKGEWDVRKVIPVSMELPTAGFRIVAEDYADFKEMFSKELGNGDIFSVMIEYECDIPSAFNLTEDVPIRPSSNVTFSRDLDYIVIPVAEMEIASDRLFATKEAMPVSLRITVFNSAKAIVARTSGVSFPIERGKITTVSGRFLTNFISGGISVDTNWEGEITIDIDDPPDN